jgi:hypothetical protein
VIARRVAKAGLVLLTAWCAICAAPARAEPPPPTPAGFAWRAPIELPAGASVARVDLPAAALLHLQSSDARDLRVYNAAGEAVAFARFNVAMPPPARTHSYAALPLYTSAAATVGARSGSVQVRIEEPGQQRSVWVRMDGADVPGVPKLASALFPMKDEQRLISAIEVQGTIPANTPIRIAASSSADLAQWTPTPLRGRLYRFEGEGAPVNMTLEFERPISVDGRFLRLDWSGQDGVAISAITGVVAPVSQAPARVRAELPAPAAAANGAVELATGFLTPIAALQISASRDNSLLPVRILGRNEPGQPWRLLGQSVVYRLGPGGAAGVNPPAPLHGASARWLRIESTNGADLGAAGLKLAAEFEPVRLVFVATGAGPFEVAAGRAATPPAALASTMISAVLGQRKLDDLPLAALGPPVLKGETPPNWLAAVWPGVAPNKALVLWGVLLAGVLLLAAVAWSLLRQLKTKPPTQP